MEEYIRAKAAQMVDLEDREAFFEDAIEDLYNLDEVRMAGLGITLEELRGLYQQP